MSNVGADRRVESDWWKHPIPPNVDFGEGFYCETAQVFRFMKTKAPHAVRLRQSCFGLRRLFLCPRE